MLFLGKLMNGFSSFPFQSLLKQKGRFYSVSELQQFIALFAKRGFSVKCMSLNLSTKTFLLCYVIAK